MDMNDREGRESQGDTKAGAKGRQNSETVLAIREVDRVEITTIIDNYINLAMRESTDLVRRWTISKREGEPPVPVAEHGFSVLIRVFCGSDKHALLLDAGFNKSSAVNNARILGLPLDEVEQVVLSHGHMDHYGGMAEMIGSLPRKPVDLYLHPDALIKTRFARLPDGREVKYPPPDVERLKANGARMMITKEPALLASGFFGYLGEIPRLNDFETGYPYMFNLESGSPASDLMKDDTAVVVCVKNRGLVVITGCAHSGVVNTVWHAKKLTGIEDVYLVMGGFHLTGSIFEPRIERTVEEMIKIDPVYVAPTHCTGWKAMGRFSEVFGEKFILNTVGTTIIMKG